MPITVHPGTREYALSHPPDQTIVAVDVGFASSKRTTGVAVYERGTLHAEDVRFGDAPAVIASYAEKGDLILVLEAPLTMTFDRHGNPVGRSIEKRGTRTRYWYCGLGTSVLLAAVLLLETLRDFPTVMPHTVHLYEGFVSFKPSRTGHRDDALRLIQVLRREIPGEIMDAGSLMTRQASVLRSTLRFAGLSGMPAVVVPAPAIEPAPTDPRHV